jgi:hypothetical protein
VTVRVSEALPEQVLTEMEAAVDRWPDDGAELARLVKNLCREKYDEFLSEALLRDEYTARRLDLDLARGCAESMLRGSRPG